MSIDLDALEDAWDDDATGGPRGRPLASPAAKAERGRQRTGRVVAVDRGRIRVMLTSDTGEVTVDARYGGAMHGRKVVVGDRVRVSLGRRDEPARVVERRERQNELVRTGDDLDTTRRVLVADADAVAVVVGLDNLEAGLRFADRVIVAATSGGIATALVVNKIDRADGPTPAALHDALAPYADAVVTTLQVSATTGAGLDALRAFLAQQWTVLTGHSGVGKTSLLNALVPEADRRIGEVGPRGGRHTTVASVALPLPGGGWLVDTPGVRSFGLGMLDRRGVAAGFPELSGLACGLDDCRHDGEPGCALPLAGLPEARRTAFERLASAVDQRQRPVR